MSKGEAAHEFLVHRLVDILRRLNDGEKLDPKELARVHNTSVRTIQRDLRERLPLVLPVEKMEDTGLYHIPAIHLGKLKLNDIHRFAALVGAADLFPNLDQAFLMRLLSGDANQAYESKGQFNEDASKHKHLFIILEPAILHNHKVSVYYRGDYHLLEPYKLIHHRGCWYLAAVREQVLKAYRLSFIQDLQILKEQQCFSPKPEILEQLRSEENIWFGQVKQEAIVKVAPDVATHFKQRSLLPQQQLVKELDDGSLIISSQYVDTRQILSLVRYWMPHIKIVSPESLHKDLFNGIKQYYDAHSLH